MRWQHRWPIVDQEKPWLDLCAEAWVELVEAIHCAGLRMVGQPDFTIRGDDMLLAEVDVEEVML